MFSHKQRSCTSHGVCSLRHGLEFSASALGINQGMNSTELNLTPTDLKSKFYNLQTFEDLALLLDVPKSKLYYYAFKADLKKHYKEFEIPKKSGGVRKIVAPSSPLKIIQRKLDLVFRSVYIPKASVHGFVETRSILSNASRHVQKGKKFIFNADLKDFFPSITRYRIEGLLKAQPYNLPKLVAKAISHLCCYEDMLPQGAPTSPVLSNMICAKMDTQLRKLAQNSRCFYTRYADDITFSTTLNSFPPQIATTDEETNALITGDLFRGIVESNGFQLNVKKIRLQPKHKRQEITGLVVNRFPNVQRKYVRQIRAMLHAIETYGIEKAQNEYVAKYASGRKVSLLKVLRGKIEFLKMIRGENNLIYKALSKKLEILDTDYAKYRKSKKEEKPAVGIYVVTEGKSDWKHLKDAFMRFQKNNEYTELLIEFYEYDDDPPMGDAELLKRTNALITDKADKININIFDRDNKEIINKASTDGGNNYKKWTNRLYSFVIPVPSIRPDSDICIELYYSDKDIIRKDKSGKRLFLSSEFDKRSQRHNTENLNCTDRNKFKANKLSIIDTDVYDAKSNPVALAKDRFAKNILYKIEGFEDLDISEFRLIFDMIRKIVKENPLSLS